MNIMIRACAGVGAALFLASALAHDAPPAARTSDMLEWHVVARAAFARSERPEQERARTAAYLSLAHYAIAVEAGDKDALATASMRILAALVPDQADYAVERHRRAQARISEHGLRIAFRLLDAAARDGFGRSNEAAPLGAAYAWRSLAEPPAPPFYPTLGTMRTFFIESGSVFRAPRPPALGSARFRADLAEAQHYAQAPTEESARIAKRYDAGQGSSLAGLWNARAIDLIRAGALPATHAATVLATLNASLVDALAACHDTKYAYWVPRPSQADPTLKTLVEVPNNPSYPSNHACMSATASRVLAHFFPADRDRLVREATEAGAAGVYAGIHYRFDVEAGEAIGRNIADAAISEHADVLARRVSK